MAKSKITYLPWVKPGIVVGFNGKEISYKKLKVSKELDLRITTQEAMYLFDCEADEIIPTMMEVITELHKDIAKHCITQTNREEKKLHEQEKTFLDLMFSVATSSQQAEEIITELRKRNSKLFIKNTQLDSMLRTALFEENENKEENNADLAIIIGFLEGKGYSIFLPPEVENAKEIEKEPEEETNADTAA